MRTVKDMMESSIDLLEFIVSKLCSVVMDSSVHLAFELSFIDNCGADGNATSWLHPSSKGAKQISTARASLAAGATLLRVLACHQFGFDCTAVGDEQIERAITLAGEFIKLNGTVSSSSQTTEKSKSSIKKTIKSAAQADSDPEDRDERLVLAVNKAKAKLGTRKLMQEIGRIFLPLLSSLLQALPAVLLSRRQGDRLVISAYEISYMSIKLDSSVCPRVELLDPTTGQLLTAVHKAAVAVLVALGRRYPTHRAALVQEHLGLLSTTLTVRTPSKSFIVSTKSSGPGGLSHKSISMSTASLCIFLQGMIASTAVMGVGEGGSVNMSEPPDSVEAQGNKRAKKNPITTPSPTPTKSKPPLDMASGSKIGFFSPAQTDELSEVSKTCLADAQRFVNMFISELLSRCAHKDMFSEYRVVATVLTSDLLTALSCPTLPALPMLLEALLRRLLSEVTSGLSDKDSVKKDISYINFMMDLLGNLAAGIRNITLAAEKQREGAADTELDERSLSAVRDKIEQMESGWTKEAESERLTESKEAIAKGKAKTGSKSSNGDKSSYYSLDLAIRILDSVSAVTLDALSQHTADGDDFITSGNVPDPLSVLRQLDMVDLIQSLSPVIYRDQCGQTLCEYLRSLLSTSATHQLAAGRINSALATGSSNSRNSVGNSLEGDEHTDAYATALIQWHRDAVTAGRTKAVKYIHKLLLGYATSMSGGSFAPVGTGAGTGLGIAQSERIHVLSADTWRASLSAEWAAAAYRSLLTDRLLGAEYDKIVQALLMLLAEPQPQIRARVLKTFSSVMKVDAELISQGSVRESVTERFNDMAISVREEAVKLVGSFVVRGYDLSQGYLPGLLHRLRDKGVSVRKAVVAIIRDLLLYQPSHPQYAQLCMALLERSAMPKEEDTIKDIICSTFQKIWFLPPTERAVHSSAKPKKQLMSSGKNRSVNGEDDGEDGDQDPTDGICDDGDEFDDDVDDYPSGDEDSMGPVLSNMSRIAPGTQVFLDLREWGDSWYESVGLPDPSPKRYIVRGVYGAVNARRIEVSFPVFASSQRVDNRWIKLHKHTAPRGRQYISSRHILVDAEFCLAHPQIFLEEDDDGITRQHHLDRLEAELANPGPISYGSPGGTSRGGSGATSKRVNMSEALQNHTETTAMQMIDVVASCEQLGWMIGLIREMLHGKGQGYEVAAQVLKRRKESHAHCAKIVSSLFEMLIRAEEQDVRLLDLMKRTLGQSSGAGTGEAPRLRTQKEQIVATISTLGVFCEAHPPLMLKHLDALVPYLKGDSTLTPAQESSISLIVMNIITSAVMIKGAQFTTPLDELNADLTNIALKYGLHCISAAVGCMSTIASHITNDATAYMSLAEKCFNAIAAVARTVPYPQNVNQAQVGRIQRSIVVLGAICEHSRKCMDALRSLGDLPSATTSAANTPTMKSVGVGGKVSGKDGTQSAQRQFYDKEEAIAAKNIVDIEKVLSAAVNGCCYSAAMYALSLPFESVQCRAAQALCFVFVGCPRLILLSQSTGLLGQLLSDRFPPSLHSKMLSSLKQMMMSEEIRLEKGAAVEAMKEAGVGIGDRVNSYADQDSDATVAGFVLQQHLQSLLDFLSHEHSIIRLDALQLIGTLLRQGMLCPLDVIGHCVALQGDEDSAIRAEALRLIQLEDAKHPTFLDNRLLEGIEMAFMMQIAAGRSEEAAPLCETPLFNQAGMDTGMKEVTSIFSPLYVSSIQPNRKRRLEFLNSTIRRCLQIAQQLKGVRHRVQGVTSTGSTLGTSLTTDADESKGSMSSPRERDSPRDKNGVPHSTLSSPSTSTGKLSRSASLSSVGSGSGSTAVTLVSTISGHSRGAKGASHGPKGREKNTTLDADLIEAARMYHLVCFLLTTLAHLPYDAADEPLNVIHFIRRNIPISATLHSSEIKRLLEVIGAYEREEGNSRMQPPSLGSKPGLLPAVAAPGLSLAIPPSSNVDASNIGHASIWSESGLLFDEKSFASKFTDREKGIKGEESAFSAAIIAAAQSRMMEAMLRLKSFLKVAYSFSDERLVAFSPDDKVATVADKVKMSDHCPTYTALPVAAQYAKQLPLSVSQSILPGAIQKSQQAYILLRAAVADCNRLVAILDADPEDLTISSVGKKGSKRRAASAATADDGEEKPKKAFRSKSSAKSVAGAAKKKRKRAAVALSDDDDDDDEDDEENDEDWSA